MKRLSVSTLLFFMTCFLMEFDVAAARRRICSRKQYWKQWSLRCDNGQTCLRKHDLCNGFPDCSDGYDELTEMCIDFECPRNRIKCNDQKRCIHPSNLCDGVNQCIDGSDENEATCKGRPCPPALGSYLLMTVQNVHCADGLQCIKETSVCDGMVVHCRDGSDEDEDRCRNATCPPLNEKCRDNIQCTLSMWMCDGKVNCNDHSDEDNIACVSLRQCGYNMFKCASGECISVGNTCNGYDDSGDNSDEAEDVWLYFPC